MYLAWGLHPNGTRSRLHGSVPRSRCFFFVAYRSQDFCGDLRNLYDYASPDNSRVPSVSVASFGFIPRAAPSQDHESLAHVHIIHGEALPHPRCPPRSLWAIPSHRYALASARVDFNLADVDCPQGQTRYPSTPQAQCRSTPAQRRARCTGIPATTAGQRCSSSRTAQTCIALGDAFGLPYSRQAGTCHNLKPFAHWDSVPVIEMSISL